MFGLLGPNGAGKSTLMRTIANLQDADSGSVHQGDLDVLADKTRARRRLGDLQQEFGVYRNVSAVAMLDHFAILKGVVDGRQRKELVHALLRQVNLWPVRHRKLGKFSGGSRQRFGLAQALIGKPQLIIVYEHNEDRDPQDRHRLTHLLAEVGEPWLGVRVNHIVEDE